MNVERQITTGTDEDDALAHAHLGSLYANAGQHAPAVASLERAVALGFDDARAHRMLAHSYERLGDITNCVRAWRQVLLHTPNDADAQWGLAQSLSKLSVHSEAHFHRATVLRSQGDREKARELFAKAAMLAESDKASQRALGQITIDVARSEQAPPQNNAADAAQVIREKSAFSGDLEPFPIANLLQLLERQRVSGFLVLDGPNGRAAFAFVNGALAGAITPGRGRHPTLSQSVARTLEHVLTWSQGQFAFYKRTAPTGAMETVETQRALFDAMLNEDGVDQ